MEGPGQFACADRLEIPNGLRMGLIKCRFITYSIFLPPGFDCSPQLSMS
jgi:hypothetical protein